MGARNPVPRSDSVERVLNRLTGVKSKGGGGWIAACPAHEDRRPSMSVDVGDDGRVLLHCFRCCPTEAIVAELGMTMADLFPSTAPAVRKNGHSRIAETYDYRDEDGTVLCQVVRTEPKGFWQRRPNGKGGWIMNLDDVRRVLYRLPELLASDPDAPVFVCEGEKDADALAALGLVATCNMGGAGGGKWRPEYGEALRGRAVVVLPDNDDPGRAHAEQVARLATAAGAAEVRVLALPGLPDKGDVSDWLAAGGDAPALRRLIAAAPIWTPGVPPPPEAPAPRPVAPWPALDPAALFGLPGDVVRAVEPHTEGDPVAILVNYLVMAGNAIGSGPHVRVGGARHGVAGFAVLVGETAKARKGTAHSDTLQIVKEADPNWAGTRVTGGLSSGEGLVYPIRDATETTKKGERVVTDPGEPDKRLLVVEEEFSAVLKVATREGNTLSEQLRKAWDGRRLGAMTRNSPLHASDPHVSILAHVTKDELLRVFDSADAANGFGNRFAWFAVKRSKFLPEGGRVPADVLAQLATRTRDALAFARRQGEVRRDDDARALWADVYPVLSEARPGLLGSLTARAEAHVLRWSLIFALLDHAPAIGTPHLLAALALSDRAEASARHVFGDATGDPIADRLLAALRTNGPMAQTEVVDLFGRHVNAGRLGRAQEDLVQADLIRSEQESTGGRPRTVWRAA